jgi:cystathionine beta-lyase/cystathionine gamma-synthase
MKFATKAIHAGVEPDPSTGAIMTPIYQTSTYVQDSPGVHKGYEYARTQNPTRSALEASIAGLENASYGLAFSSGMAALDAVVKLLSPGDEVLSVNDLYGGSYRAFTKVFAPLGIRFRFISMEDASSVANEIRPETKMIWVETPTNPLLSVVDIAEVAELSKKQGSLLVVDNTFASPYLQNPMDLGADIVLHSATKYLGGHSDVVLGALALNDKELADRLYFIQNSTGAVAGPQDSFLMLRGIKTLHLRVQRSCENASQIADYLKSVSAIDKVLYPGFSDHPNHEIAKKQMRDFGGMVSFTLKEDTIEAANKVLSATHLFALAESLGGVESLIGHPATMTHEDRVKNGLADSLIRLSVGVEDVDDLIADLRDALS